jgi:filamentous hemagglutinin
VCPKNARTQSSKTLRQNPKKCYEDAPISSADGPAIKMDPLDHQKTASNGNGAKAKEYRAKQKQLLNEGKLEDALQMDIDDIRSNFGNKYDDAIKEMQDYARTLDPSVFKSP